jgi:hypothetical protein
LAQRVLARVRAALRPQVPAGLLEAGQPVQLLRQQLRRDRRLQAAAAAAAAAALGQMVAAVAEYDLDPPTVLYIYIYI